MNQPQVYRCPHILNPPPASLPTPSLWVAPEHRLHAWNLNRASTLHMVIDMFQSHFLKNIAIAPFYFFLRLNVKIQPCDFCDPKSFVFKTNG